MFNRILVANRGEIALRVIRACHDLGVEAVAVFSEADRGAAYLRHPDEAIFIGPPEEAMRRLGNKDAARQLARSAGVPVVPGSDGLVTTGAQAAALAAGI